ncbi:hypothetical protein M3B11_03055 [Brevibacterium sp. p3-SID960]|uniref:hypothetical protein n=1 Tax=Brevibacterium sp. p3-SID960 TaxID=2916063 RepID=UPI0021A7FA66|nr:hypothetical protein [Brevibacterium sp. p3-SID960]MCT1689944.1 hypothetical protein [Brevibacterium sp. p3-SID960]
MDLIRAWLFAAGALVVVNLALGFTVGSGIPLLYLLPTFLAGLVASAYHAQLGRGGWGRHLVAVAAAPVAISVYWLVLRYVQHDFFHPLTTLGVLASSAVSALAGMAVVMGVRWLLAERSDRLDSDSSSPRRQGQHAAGQHASRLPKTRA